MPENYQSIELQITSNVAVLTLNRPEKYNAFNARMLHEIRHALTYLQDQDSLSVLVLNAHGKNFCAGADIGWMAAQQGNSYDENLRDATLIADVLDQLYHFPTPVLAVVQGVVRGGGVGLLACADWVVAASEANFALSEVNLGLIPATILPYLLQAMPARLLQPYLLNASVFNTTTALQLGLIHCCVSIGQMQSLLQEQIDAISQNAPMAVRECKAFLRQCQGALDDDCKRVSSEKIAHIRVSAEAQTRMAEFLEKRHGQVSKAMLANQSLNTSNSSYSGSRRHDA